MISRNRFRVSIGHRLLTVAILFAAAMTGWAPFALAATSACIDQTANPPASSDSGGIGGTGGRAEGGVGATGVFGTEVVEQGGIGGTGDMAKGGIGGTGIVGTVTGFASVCINGLEVHYDASTPVTRNGLPADVTALALGQVIAVDAARTERGLVAQHISILNVLEGPVTGANAASGMIQVMGQVVRADASTRLGGLPTLAEVRLGMALRVAGFRDASGEIYATRIATAPDLASSSAIGVVKGPSTGDASLDGLRVHIAAPLPAAASEVLLRGHWDGRHLVAREAHPDPSLPFAGHADRVVAEGLVLERRDRAHLRIAGFEVELSSETRITGSADGRLVEGQRIRVTGRLEGKNRVVAHRIDAGDIPFRRGSTSTSVRGAHGSATSSDSATMMDRRGTPDRPQRMERMERIPIPRPDMPAGMGMPGMRM